MQLKEIFPVYGLAKICPISKFYNIIDWTIKTNRGGLFSAIKSRIDLEASVYDKRNPIARHHGFNMVSIYCQLREWEIASERAEGNNPAYLACGRDGPEVLMEKQKKMWDMVWNKFM